MEATTKAEALMDIANPCSADALLFEHAHELSFPHLLAVN